MRQTQHFFLFVLFFYFENVFGNTSSDMETVLRRLDEMQKEINRLKTSENDLRNSLSEAKAKITILDRNCKCKETRDKKKSQVISKDVRENHTGMLLFHI